MTIFITGSQGFIGSYLCQYLLKEGHKVVGIDNYSKYGYVSRPQDNHPNFAFIRDDAKDSRVVASIMQTHCPDYIIACAARIGGISYFHKYAYDLLAENERITATIFDHAIRAYLDGVLKRIVVVSSSMVFENTTIYPTKESDLCECLPPSSTYGFQKLATEYFAKGAHEQYGLPYTIVRPFNAIGVGENDAIGSDEEAKQGNIKLLLSHVVPDLIFKSLQLRSTDKLPILGDGYQVRHYTHGMDVARGICTAMVSPMALNTDFNISSPRPTRVRELATIIWNKIHGNNPVFQHDRPFAYDVQVRSPDVQKAKNLIGFETQISLEQSIDEVIVWMANQYPNLLMSKKVLEKYDT